MRTQQAPPRTRPARAILVVVAVAVVALAVWWTVIRDDHTITYSKVTVDQPVRFCNLQTDGEANVCVGDSTTYLNRVNAEDRAKPVWKQPRITLWLATFPGDNTPSVFDAS